MSLPIHFLATDAKILPPMEPPPIIHHPLPNWASNDKFYFSEIISNLPRRLKNFAKLQIKQWEEDLGDTLHPEEITKITRERLGKLVFVANRCMDHLDDPLNADKVSLGFAKECASLFQAVAKVRFSTEMDLFESSEEFFRVQLGQILGCALITENGMLNVGIIDEIRILDGDLLFKSLLDLLTIEFQEYFHKIQAPLDQHSNAARLIRAQLQMNATAQINDIHAKQVALGALFAETGIHWTKAKIEERLTDFESLLRFGLLGNDLTLPLVIEENALSRIITISPQGNIFGTHYSEIGSLANAMRQIDSHLSLDNDSWETISIKALIQRFAGEEEEQRAFYGFVNHKHRLIEARKKLLNL